MDVDKGLNQILDLKALYTSAWTYIRDICVYAIGPEIPCANDQVKLLKISEMLIVIGMY